MDGEGTTNEDPASKAVEEYAVEPQVTPEMQLSQTRANYDRVHRKIVCLGTVLTSRREELAQIVMDRSLPTKKLRIPFCALFLDWIMSAYHLQETATPTERRSFDRTKMTFFNDSQGSMRETQSRLRPAMAQLLAWDKTRLEDEEFETRYRLIREPTGMLDQTWMAEARDYCDFAEVRADRGMDFLDGLLDAQQRPQFMQAINENADPFDSRFHAQSHEDMDDAIIDKALTQLEQAMPLGYSYTYHISEEQSVAEMARLRNGRTHFTAEERHMRSIPHRRKDHAARYVDATAAGQHVKEGGVCLICHMSYEKGQDGIALMACGHYFHRQCWETWLMYCPRHQHGICAYCRHLSCWAEVRHARRAGDNSSKSAAAADFEEVPEDMDESEDEDEDEDEDMSELSDLDEGDEEDTVEVVEDEDEDEDDEMDE